MKRHITTTERDDDVVTAALRAWLAVRVGATGPVELTVRERPDTGGFSSASILFDASWAVDGVTTSGSFVARTAPEATVMAVFPRYDMAEQFGILRVVSDRSEVPVPRLHWMEPDATVLGAPFFVMDRAHGQVPPDHAPYVFDSWLLEATPEQQQCMQDSSVETLVKIHAIADVEHSVPSLCPADPTAALRQHLDAQREYYQWALMADGIRVPIIDRAFGWLEDRFPTEPGPNVLSWGDARIGNIMYEDFRAVAVFDWEMAALGPRELDLGWFIFFHRFFQDFADLAGVVGLPDLLRRSDVVDAYQKMSGVEVRDLDFYLVYAALRHAVIMARIKRRMIHFGEDTTPADPDDFVLHRPMLEKLLAGTYTWT